MHYDACLLLVNNLLYNCSLLTLTNPREVMEQAFATTPTVFLSRYPTPIAELQSDSVPSVTRMAMSAVFLRVAPSRLSAVKRE